MLAITFDTFEYITALISAGFTEKQAETMSDLQRTTLEQVLSDRLASREDIYLLKDDVHHAKDAFNTDIQHLRDEIHIIRDDLKRDFYRLEKEVIKIDGKFNLLHWMFGFILASQLSIFFKLFA